MITRLFGELNNIIDMLKPIQGENHQPPRDKLILMKTQATKMNQYPHQNSTNKIDKTFIV